MYYYFAKFLNFIIQIRISNPITFLLNFKKPEIYVYEANGLKFNIRKNTYDKHIINVIVKKNEYSLKIEKNFTVLDLGANIGSFSILASKQCNKVISYEPDLENFNLLKKNLKLNNCTNVKTYNLAVSDKNGFLKLKKNNYNHGNHTLVKNSSKGDAVKIIDLRKVFKDNDLKKIDLVKCDVEGSEYEIFNSSVMDLLKKIDRIELEYHYLIENKDSYNDFIERKTSLTKLFQDSGFKVIVKPKFGFNFSVNGIIHAVRK